MCVGQECGLKINVFTKIDEEPISAGFYKYLKGNLQADLSPS